ncbi:hypothetical protein [Agrococcus jejuensis]|uniref:hypothetical protein n=1 Tax=Agrococcus jejuensis TaxID=399736 RepID=UPI0011A1A70E|nr:hypothetical protein [Agrococcus jejuensis]
MNKTVAYAIGAAVAVVGLLGIAYITVERPDATATFTSTTVLVIGIVTTFFVTVNGQAKVADRLENVERNTNGRLGAKDNEITELQRKLLAAGLDPQTGQPVTGSVAQPDAQPDPQQPG